MVSAGPGNAEPAPAEAPPRMVSALPRLVVEWLATTPRAKARVVEGTMVFVDISGFTALSERLSRRGKAGAEELTEILDGIFARLLTRAWALGGGLVRFGGDALLLLFRGEDHASQACAAAFDLRLELAESGRLQTSAGPVALEMSVGVHTGQFDFFLVGRSHRELLLTGPAASRTVEAESRANAREILLTADTAAGLDPGVLGASRHGGHLLAARPAAEQVADPGVEGIERLPLSSCVPVGLRRRLAAAATGPEHRIVTTAFLHFMDVDGLLAAEGADAVATALESLMSTVQQRIDAYEVCLLGSDIYGDGGKLIFTAGAPASGGNDEERMLRALRELFDTPLPLPIRAGVNRGHVYAGEVGASMRRTYTVMGDAVNLAARLMQAAEPGTVVVADGVLEHSRTQFDVEPLEPFHVKGKARPVHAYRLGTVTGWRQIRATARLPLIGREREIAELDRALDSARGGRGQVVAVLGPPGVGKSRLTDELREHATDTTRLTVYCEQYEASTPFWAMGWLLRRLLWIPFTAPPEEAGTLLTEAVEGMAPDLAEWLPLLAAAVDAQVAPTAAVERLDPAYRQDRLGDVTVDLLTRLLPDPALLVFEDVFWMDDASRVLLRRLCQDADERPWLVVVTARDAVPNLLPEADPVRTVEIRGLALEQAVALASAASEHDPRPAHELRTLAQRAQGNPLFLLELLGSGARGDTDALPETIEAAMSARIDTLEPPDRTLLRCASVLGVTFSTALAADALRSAAPEAADTEVWGRLGEFLAAAGGQVRFRQALLRDVAYEGLPYRRRRAIHDSVAQRLEGSTPEEADANAELLALHFLRAERFPKAWQYARVAGHRARTKAATVEAAGFYRQALDAAAKTTEVEPAEAAEVAEVLGDVCELGGLYEEGARAYRVARRLNGDDATAVAELLRKEGLLHERSARYRHARMLYHRGRELLEAEGAVATPRLERVRAALHVVTAASLIVEGRYRAGVWWARRAVALATTHDVRSVLAHAYYLMDWAFTDLGDAEAASYRGKAVPIYEELGDLDGLAKTLNNLGGNAYYEGDWSEALACYERSREALQEIGNVVEAATVTCNIGEVLLQQGHLERAESMFREGLGVFRGAGKRITEAWATCNLGLIAGRTGDLAEAATLITQASETFRAIGAETYAAEAVARLAEISVLGGDHRHARSLLARARADAEARGGLPFLEAALDRTLGYALLQAGDREHAAEALADSLAKAEASGASYEVALTLDAMARASRAGGAAGEEYAQRSRVIFDQLGVVATPDVPVPAADDRVGPSRQATGGS